MAVAVQAAMVIPGLHIPPTVEDLKRSLLTFTFKSGPVSSSVSTSKTSSEYILSTDTSKLKKVTLCSVLALTSVRGWWTKPTGIMDLNAAEVHGHIFRLTRSGEMQAYEYREGSTINLNGVDSAFFRELVKYLQDNGLTDLLGLQILDKEVLEMMCEFVLKDNGTVMLDARDVKKWESYRLTGFALNGLGMIELKGNESHSKTVKDTHQVFIDGKIGKEDPLIDVLKAEDIIH